VSTPTPSKNDGMGVVYLSVVGLACAFVWWAWQSWHADLAYHGLQWSWHLLGLVDGAWAPSVIGQWRLEAARLAAGAPAVSWAELVAAMNNAGYVFVGLPVLLAFRSIRLANRHRANLTRRQVDAGTLPWIMAKHSPAIIPALYYGDPDTLLLNVNPPEHRSALNPEEWVSQHGLLVNGVLKRDRCRDLLVADLGPRISSLDELQAHERVLFAVFGARLLRHEPSDKPSADPAQALLDALNRSCHHGTHLSKRGYPNLALGEASFTTCARHPDAALWLQKHPYARTMLHAMHQAALRSGALPSSHFRWLKGLDRGLWYALNTTGRKAAFIESAAVFTQTQWEQFAFESGYQLAQPCLDDAVAGVEHYLIKMGLIAASAAKPVTQPISQSPNSFSKDSPPCP
jgi:intracellular multiplication protein IcmP